MSDTRGEPHTVAVLGGSSLVGQCLLPRLGQAGRRVLAWSRRRAVNGEGDGAGVEWRQLPAETCAEPVSHWVSLIPLWVLPDYFPLLEAAGARRVVVLSSTSRFTKADSGDPAEVAVAARLAEGEEQLSAWARSRGIDWVVLRPTLIYGFGRDKNIAEIAHFIRRFGFFPVLGRARGLRQPIHADDVAQACLAALQDSAPANRAYQIVGAETLPYRELVKRVFVALERPPRLVTVPLWMFRIAVTVLHLLPRYRHWTTAMAERMNRDLVFDCDDARQHLSFRPRPFSPGRQEVAR